LSLRGDAVDVVEDVDERWTWVAKSRSRGGDLTTTTPATSSNKELSERRWMGRCNCR
jgi:hypothetical protein